MIEVQWTSDIVSTFEGDTWEESRVTTLVHIKKGDKVVASVNSCSVKSIKNI